MEIAPLLLEYILALDALLELQEQVQRYIALGIFSERVALSDECLQELARQKEALTGKP